MWRTINLLVLYVADLSCAQAALTLPDAEQLALKADPAVSASQSRANALQEQSVADGQLPDPKLTFGVFNVPLDDLSMKKEASSQLRTGVRQAFPRGKTLHYQQQRTEWLGKAEQARTLLTEKQIQRDVRETFLELYYQLKAARIIEQNRVAVPPTDRDYTRTLRIRSCQPAGCHTGTTGIIASR